MTIELRHGRYQDVMHDVMCDHLITDPPFSERTHSGQRHGRKDPRYTKDKSTILSAKGLPYEPWTAKEIIECVHFWHERTQGWMCIFTSHDLIPLYSKVMKRAGRYVFAPIPCIQMYRNVRLAGDGPANWTDYLVVSRPRTMRFWRALPGVYIGASHDPGENALDRSKRAVPGGKPVWLMQQIIEDYSDGSDLIADCCVGGGSTLIAAASLERHAIGAEKTAKTYKKALHNISKFKAVPLELQETGHIQDLYTNASL